MKGIFTIITIIMLSSHSWSAEFYCRAVKKYDFEKVYTKDELKNSQFATKLEDYGQEAYLSRCSYGIIAGGKVTCDRYKVDRIESDQNVKIKKYYVFRSQFNFQIFPDLNSIEDNGRGSIQYGKCEIIAP